ncbi:ankyrin repeat domain-containing protein [Treponema sp.]|uniref:ankyrin repeat domain-containing protein n=1 Tax=Treponema sp. TaxID=166 RepID=UPI00388D5199
MKWLILKHSADNAEKISIYLQSKNCQVSIVDIDSDYSSLVSEIKGAKNFFVSDSNVLADNPKFLYLYGLISERGQFILVQGKNVDELKSLSGESEKFVYGSTKAEVLKVLKSDFKDYYAADKKSSALNDLLSRGLPFNADCMVHFIEKDKPEIVELVYDAGLDINSWTEDGVPVLCAAARCDKVEYVKWLLKRNADVNIISKDRGYSPVMDAVWKKNLEMVKLFIKAGADLGIMSSDGQPILVLAVGNGNAKIVEVLLKAGADPDIKDGMGMSARGYANLFKKTDIMKLMEKFPKKE